jgi:hypothetical protein
MAVRRLPTLLQQFLDEQPSGGQTMLNTLILARAFVIDERLDGSRSAHDGRIAAAAGWPLPRWLRALFA